MVVVAFCDPADKGQTPASAVELTRKQAEAVIEFLKARGVHKLGWTTRRKMTPLGMGMNPSPVVEKETLPPSNVQVLLFTPSARPWFVRGGLEYRSRKRLTATSGLGQ